MNGLKRLEITNTAFVSTEVYSHHSRYVCKRSTSLPSDQSGATNIGIRVNDKEYSINLNIENSPAIENPRQYFETFVNNTIAIWQSEFPTDSPTDPPEQLHALIDNQNQVDSLSDEDLKTLALCKRSFAQVFNQVQVRA